MLQCGLQNTYCLNGFRRYYYFNINQTKQSVVCTYVCVKRSHSALRAFINSDRMSKRVMQRRKEAERRLVEDSVCVCCWQRSKRLQTPQKNPERPQPPERRGLALPDYLLCHTPVIPHSLKPQTQWHDHFNCMQENKSTHMRKAYVYFHSTSGSSSKQIHNSTNWRTECCSQWITVFERIGSSVMVVFERLHEWFSDSLVLFLNDLVQ